MLSWCPFSAQGFTVLEMIKQAPLLFVLAPMRLGLSKPKSDSFIADPHGREMGKATRVD